ncbi:unnamed protein product [Musa textilis]
MDGQVGLGSAEGIGSGGMNDAPVHIPCFLIDYSSMSTGASLRPCCHFSTLERWLGGEKRCLGGGCIPIAGNASTRYGAFLCHFGGTSHDDAMPKTLV